jgi:hypothetical protein
MFDLSFFTPWLVAPKSTGALYCLVFFAHGVPFALFCVYDNLSAISFSVIRRGSSNEMLTRVRPLKPGVNSVMSLMPHMVYG